MWEAVAVGEAVYVVVAVGEVINVAVDEHEAVTIHEVASQGRNSLALIFSLAQIWTCVSINLDQC